MDDQLKIFHPLIASWFEQKVGAPTAIQQLAWPAIARGEHVVLTAPTGSGKTLSAFMWAMDRLLRGVWDRGTTRVVYISPLKALGVDIRRNLTGPLQQLERRFTDTGTPFSDIRVQIRSGDTPPAERSRMRKRPPEILVTTPESLHILLTSRSGRLTLQGVESVILDEIHAVAGNKRGTLLMSGIERLADLSGEFQRVALSATVRPLQTVADFVGGYRRVGPTAYEPRPVTILRAPAGAKPQLRLVATPKTSPEKTSEGNFFWREAVRDLRPRIASHRSTLIFANGRRLAEKLARYLNEEMPEPIAYAHHGSLSKELRAEVEQRLKDGDLPSVVATNTLELGIDIGDCEQVIMLQTPRSLASGVQRLGRAGHQVGAISHGTLHPTHSHDYLEAAVFAPAFVDGKVERLAPVRAPLDVAAQVLVSMVAAGAREAEDLFAELRQVWSFQTLTREAFDLVLDMLCGRRGEERLRELKPLLRFDPTSGQVSARDGASMVFYANSGVIPDRGYFTIRLQPSNARVGELDEEFVWERDLGDEFSIGTQTWKIVKIDHNDVHVVPGTDATSMAPFWRAESQDRSYEASAQIGDFLQQAEDRLEDPKLRQTLIDAHFCEPDAADNVLDYLRRQHQTTRGLPHSQKVVIEHCPDAAGQGHLSIIHAFWGGSVLRPLALALAAAWQETNQSTIHCSNNDSAILVQLPHPAQPGELLRLVNSESVEHLLRQRLEQSGFFGARFRENAAVALLLPRRHLKRRLPLWLNRQRAKKLLQRVRKIPDFPILAETWRTCLEDSFDLPQLRQQLDQLRDGTIAVTEVHNQHASPFADDLTYQRINVLMYEDDTPVDQQGSSLSQRVLEQVVSEQSLRPKIAEQIAGDLRARLHRTWPGYAPDSAEQLIDLLRERLLIPHKQWLELLAASDRDHQFTADQAIAGTTARALLVRLGKTALWCVCTVDTLPRILHATGRNIDNIKMAPLSALPKVQPHALEPTAQQALDHCLANYRPQNEHALAVCLSEFLCNEGPVEPSYLASVWGLHKNQLAVLLDNLIQDGLLLQDQLLQDSDKIFLCDRENLERCLRLQRAARRPAFRAQPLTRLPLFLATWHGLFEQAPADEKLENALGQLFGFPAAAGLWEKEFLPARVTPYQTEALDQLCLNSPLMWFGCGKQMVTFCFGDGLGLFNPDGQVDPQQQDQVNSLFPDARGRYDLGALAAHSGKNATELSELLWQHLWASRISADSLALLRQGIRNRFRAAVITRSHRRSFGSWRSATPFVGSWSLLQVTAPSATESPLEALEWDKQRVRVLLDRYGVLFRELLAHELPPLGWRRMQVALRTMELSGELVSGHFFSGIMGLQFASPEAVRLLQTGLDEDAVFMVNACDPISCCGCGLELELPPRLASSHLVFRGQHLVLVSRRHGEELEILGEPQEDVLTSALGHLARLLNRQFEPLQSMRVKTINQQNASASDYKQALLDCGFVQDYGGLELRRTF